MLFIKKLYFSLLGENGTSENQLCDNLQSFSLVLSIFCSSDFYFLPSLWGFLLLDMGGGLFGLVWFGFLYKSSYLLSCLKCTTKCVLEDITKHGNPAST